MTHRLMSRAMVMSSIMHGMDPSMHDGCGRRSQRRFFFRGISPPRTCLQQSYFLYIHGTIHRLDMPRCTGAGEGAVGWRHGTP